MKTIKQVADELGISKQRLYRYIKKHCISDVHHDAGVMYITDALENNIKTVFSENEAHHDAGVMHITDTGEAHHDAGVMHITDTGEAHHDAVKIAELEREIIELKHRIELLEQQNQALKEDKLDLQRNRDNLVSALTVSKTDLARLENIIMRISSLPLGKRVFGWSGAIARLTMQPDADTANVIEVTGETNETVSK